MALQVVQAFHQLLGNARPNPRFQKPTYQPLQQPGTDDRGAINLQGSSPNLQNIQDIPQNPQAQKFYSQTMPNQVGVQYHDLSYLANPPPTNLSPDLVGGPLGNTGNAWMQHWNTNIPITPKRPGTPAFNSNQHQSSNIVSSALHKLLGFL